MGNLFPMPDSLAAGRSSLAIDILPGKRKQLGQCFTGLQTGRLLAALAVHHGQRRIADPMAGHGDLLEAAAERAYRLHLTCDELLGVEIEPEAARLGKWRVEQCVQEFGVSRGRFIHGDTFATKNWDESHSFDLIITNPPYVRYQTLSNGVNQEGVKLLNVESTRNALKKLAGKLAPPKELLIWQSLIQSYSGLADLSLPSWLLCGLLTAPSGILALVVPQAWLNRDYARIARYFFLRFFQPMAVIQESGQRWFRDVLIPVSLVIGRRLPSEQVVTPLRERRCTFGDTPFVEVYPEAASESSHVGKAFTSDDPEGDFADWLQNGKVSKIGVNLNHVSWEFQRHEVLSLSRDTNWLRRIEGDSQTRIDAAISSSATLPASIVSRLPTNLLNNTRPLKYEPIRVGQGLRTGCNDFFYVDLAEDITHGDSVQVLTSNLFGRRRITVPISVLKPVLRKQAELSGMRITPGTLHGRLLDLRGFVLPEDALRNKSVTQNREHIMPEELATHVRLAARTYLVRGGKQTLIPCLSAVKTNGLGPSEERELSPFLDDTATRMWYMIPNLAPRHVPLLCVPRIINDEPNAILNTEPPVLVDANFSTLWCEDDTWNADVIFAILNSTWGELCMEALGTTLGGGALKLEATHLRQLPVPNLSDLEKRLLRDLAREILESARIASEFRHQRSRIDRVVISALVQRQLSENDSKAIIEHLTKLTLSLRAKRRRPNSQKAMEDK